MESWPCILRIPVSVLFYVRTNLELIVRSSSPASRTSQPLAYVLEQLSLFARGGPAQLHHSTDSQMLVPCNQFVRGCLDPASTSSIPLYDNVRETLRFETRTSMLRTLLRQSLSAPSDSIQAAAFGPLERIRTVIVSYTWGSATAESECKLAWKRHCLRKTGSPATNR